ncbi:MAG: benzoate-CoA ligase family protein [Gammaproteobacteria bacterium]|nr:benzoate-CoA ligase family protein [Gammaproteobacteria bacterium]
MAAPDTLALGAAPDHPARPYNAAVDLVGRNIEAGRGTKCAYIDDRGRTSYAELERGVARAAAMLRGLGLAPEQRILIAMHDTVELPMLFLGAIRAGIVPVLVNTLLTADDYAYMLADSRARVAFVSAPLATQFAGAVATISTLERLVVAGGDDDQLDALLEQAGGDDGAAATWSDEPCFWLYSSGSTGAPKGTVHVHASLARTAELYAGPVLGIAADDIVFSAAKLFFAYGLGNALSFPLAVGATTVLMAERPTPEAVFERLRAHRATIFYGVPTLYAGLLASPDLPAADELALRLCTSAGEALPADIGRRWQAHFGVDILDGIGSTEMLHIFLSNRPGEVRYGTTGKPVPGYAVRLVDEHGADVAAGELGELHVAGPTAATHYWNNRARSRTTFAGPWTVTGDKYRQDEDGYYVYCGRADDMLKVGGIYVSPTEVENALISHPAVLEAAVVGRADEAGLVKPQAFVVLRPGQAGSAALAETLKQHVKTHLAPYKYPRWLEFVEALPKTATGKIQRFKLR